MKLLTFYKLCNILLKISNLRDDIKSQKKELRTLKEKSDLEDDIYKILDNKIEKILILMKELTNSAYGIQNRLTNE